MDKEIKVPIHRGGSFKQVVSSFLLPMIFWNYISRSARKEGATFAT